MVSSYQKLGDKDVLRVEINIFPQSGPKVIPIGSMEITNVGGDADYGDYKIRLAQHSNSEITVRYGTLRCFRRARGALALVRDGLKEVLTRQS